MDEETILDARGLLCPLPVLKLAKRMRGLGPGARLTLLTDDPAAVVDVPHYCTESGNRLVLAEADGAGHRFIVARV